MEFQTNLEERARSMGAFYFGIADLSAAREDSLPPHVKKLVAEYPLAISVGFPLSPEVVDRIEDQEDISALRNYGNHVYRMTSTLIDHAVSRLTLAVMQEGYRALPVPASHTLDTENLFGLFSHKIAANLAGLGWIGKSCLLVTPDRGPRVRFGTILSDAPLQPGKPLDRTCGECTICVDACPQGAFTGKPFQPSEPREVRMRAGLYNQLLTKRQTDIGANVCGMCVYICPFGKPQSRRD